MTREPERRDDREEQRRPVAEPLAQVLRRDRASATRTRRHVTPAVSRRARPVRCRNTASRSGSTSSTPPDRGTGAFRPRSSSRGSTRPRVGDEDLQLVAARAARPRRPRHVPDRRAAAATTSPLSVSRTWSCSPISATSSLRVPSARISPASMIPTRSHSRSASSM